MSMHYEDGMSLVAAPGEFFSPGYLVSMGRDGRAYATVVRHDVPWWAKGPLLRWWQARQPQIVGFACNRAVPGQVVTVVSKGSGTWPNYPRGK